MRQGLLTLLCSLLLLVPLGAGADSGDPSQNPWNREASPAEIQADYEEGHRLLKAGDYKRAIKAFKRVIRANDQHAMAYTNMAYSYRKLGEYKRAVRLYEKALEIDPKLPEAHEYMGEALVALGRIDEAKKHLAILEGLNPKLAEDLRASIRRHDRS